MVLQPEMLDPRGPGFQLHVDVRVLLFAVALALIAMLLLSLVPLSRVARPELLPILHASFATRTASRPALFRRVAIWLQIGISFALLASTGALVQSFLKTPTDDIGVTRKQVLAAFTQEPEAPVRDEVTVSTRYYRLRVRGVSLLAGLSFPRVSRG
jgi:hypothetical protein